jgi:hypothetical protein
VLAIFVALAPIQKWSQRIPRGILRSMACAAAFLLCLRGVLGLVADGRSDLVWWPTFLIGGLLFGAIALQPRSLADTRFSISDAAARPRCPIARNYGP